MGVGCVCVRLRQDPMSHPAQPHLHARILSQINPKCTFVRHGKSFISQRYYRCITCGLDSDHNKGVCEQCMKYCHAGHTLGEVNDGPFYCDCGAEAKCSDLYKAPPQPKTPARETKVRRQRT